MYASIHFNQLDVVQLLLEKQHPTELFMWMSPLEYALIQKPRIEDTSMPKDLPVDLNIYRALLEDKKTKKNLTDYKKVVNNFLCTVIKAEEGDKTDQVLPEVKQAVFKLLLEEQFESIDTDKALQVCTECKADEQLSKAIHRKQ